METKSRRVELPTIREESCGFEGYDPTSLMTETGKLRKLVTKRGIEILIPLCCTTDPVRYMKFRQTLKGKTLAVRLKELQNSGILERQAYHEIPPRVEYRLTTLVESIIALLEWMRRWSSKTKKSYNPFSC